LSELCCLIIFTKGLVIYSSMWICLYMLAKLVDCCVREVTLFHEWGYPIFVSFLDRHNKQRGNEATSTSTNRITNNGLLSRSKKHSINTAVSKVRYN
jgi:hypothetical protein